MKCWLQVHLAIILSSILNVQGEYKFVTYRMSSNSDWHAPLSKEKVPSPSFQSWCHGYSWCRGGALRQESLPKSTLNKPSFFSWLSGGSNRRQLGALGGLLQPSTLISLGTVKPINENLKDISSNCKTSFILGCRKRCLHIPTGNPT